MSGTGPLRLSVEWSGVVAGVADDTTGPVPGGARAVTPGPDVAGRIAGGRFSRGSFVAATLAVAAAAGGEAVTVREIADHAGVAVGTLYKYYSSKEQLLYATAADLLRGQLAALEEVVDRRGGPEPRLRGLVDALLTGVGGYRELALAMARADALADRETLDEAAFVRGRLSELFARCVQGRLDPRRTRQIGELLFDVWATNVSALINGRAAAPAVRRHVVLAGLLLSRSDETARPSMTR